MLVAASASLFLGYTELPSNRSDQSLAVNASEIAPDEFLGMNKMVVSSGTDAVQRVKQNNRTTAVSNIPKMWQSCTIWTGIEC
jgi:hypothetical protein